MRFFEQYKGPYQRVKQPLRYDLHCHSTASDGVLAPSVLVHQAYAAGVRILALTDHDTVDGIAEAAQAAQSLPDLHFLPGIELTCLWQGRVVHLLGLAIDPASPQLADYIALLTTLRQARGEAIAAKLVKRGLPDLLEPARHIAAGGQLGRPHFAQAMLEAGLVDNPQQAFDRYLGQGKIGDVKAQWPALEEAVATVIGAGGVALLAHPTKYNFTFTRIRQLCDCLKSLGGVGIEASYPGVTPNHLRDLLQLAARNELLVSAGSDFHSSAQHWTGLGRFPAFSAQSHVLDILAPEWRGD